MSRRKRRNDQTSLRLASRRAAEQPEDQPDDAAECHDWTDDAPREPDDEEDEQ